MQKIEFIPGKRYLYQRQLVQLECVIELNLALVQYVATDYLVRIPVSDLQALPLEGEAACTLPQDDLRHISEQAWEKARQKLRILEPILADRGNTQLLEEIAGREKCSTATLYRWLRAYDETGSVRSLVEAPHTGGRGQPRLGPQQEALIKQGIETHYLTSQKLPVTDVIKEIRQQCQKANLKLPSDNTIRSRIRALSEEKKTRYRWSKKMAKEKFAPQRGSFPGAEFPLSVVQIDHTLVDLMLVDEQYRQPLGKPWLTVAIDVFSRMVLGFYLSYDPPGAVGTGLCMAHAILPKELWLSKLGVQGEWPCWGVPSVLHADNAKEFRGMMVQRACEKYGTRLEFRPVKKPHWGGHIERMMGTFMKEVHTLPGTTFSNVRERKDYDSEQKAVLTLREFEQWLTTFIVNVYHKRLHQGIKTTPYERYREGVFGGPTRPGTGLPERLCDELQVHLDFMPGEERTIQQYGVLMDHVHYYADVLRPYVNSLEPGSGKSRLKRKFLFKRDPRDISCLYFLEPETRLYHRVPYRNTAHPPISIWELRKAIEHARLKGIEDVDEDSIFAAEADMRAIALAAAEKTRRFTKASNRMAQAGQVGATATLFQSQASLAVSNEPASQNTSTNKRVQQLTPFDGLYDDEPPTR